VPALTIITSMFLHGSVLHITFNLGFLLVFGPAIEDLCGHVRFAILYLLCGIAGGVAQIAIGPGSHIPAIGASGAIAGILGAYIINFPMARVFFRLPAILVIGVWALAQFLHGFGSLSDKVASEQGGTAYFAHIGGFCAGVLLIGLFSLRAGTVRPYRYH
jgi:membrane associated rhomboid family serine protease